MAVYLPLTTGADPVAVSLADLVTVTRARRPAPGVFDLHSSRLPPACRLQVTGGTRHFRMTMNCVSDTVLPLVSTTTATILFLDRLPNFSCVTRTLMVFADGLNEASFP